MQPKYAKTNVYMNILKIRLKSSYLNYNIDPREARLEPTVQIPSPHTKIFKNRFFF